MALMNDSRLLMQMHANRANARWVEDTEWDVPHLYEPTTLVLGRADTLVYKQMIRSMLEEGKVKQLIGCLSRTISKVLKSSAILIQWNMPEAMHKPIELLNKCMYMPESCD